MRDSATVRKLARALMDVGIARGEAARYGEDLKDLATVFRENRALAPALLNPMNELKERLALMNDICRAAHNSEAVEKFMDILVETRHIRLIADISTTYSRIHDEKAGKIRATIEAPAELPEEVLSEVRTRLEEITGKDVVLAFTRNPSLIGGLVIRLDNTIIDGSLMTQLELLKTRLSEGT